MVWGPNHSLGPFLSTKVVRKVTDAFTLLLSAQRRQVRAFLAESFITPSFIWSLGPIGPKGFELVRRTLCKTDAASKVLSNEPPLAYHESQNRETIKKRKIIPNIHRSQFRLASRLAVAINWAKYASVLNAFSCGLDQSTPGQMTIVHWARRSQRTQTRSTRPTERILIDWLPWGQKEYKKQMHKTQITYKIQYQ